MTNSRHWFLRFIRLSVVVGLALFSAVVGALWIVVDNLSPRVCNFEFGVYALHEHDPVCRGSKRGTFLSIHWNWSVTGYSSLSTNSDGVFLNSKPSPAGVMFVHAYRLSKAHKPLQIAWDSHGFEFSSAPAVFIGSCFDVDPVNAEVRTFEAVTGRQLTAEEKAEVLATAPQVLRLRVPLWCLCLLTAPYPAIVLVRGPIRRWYRRRRHQCLTCGYHLQGNLSGVCPECGTAVAPPQLASTISGVLP